MTKQINRLFFSCFFIFSIYAYSYAEVSIKNDIESFHKNILSHSNVSSSKTNSTDSRDLNILESYLHALPLLDARETSFLVKVIGIMKQFRGRSIDTNMQTIGDIDGNGEQDIIETHIFEKNGDIKVESFWKKGQRVLWHYTLKNPYLWIGPSPIFQYDKRDIWVVFTIAVYYAVPKLVKPLSESEETLISQGVEVLSKIGFKVTQREYQSYLKNFKGLILQYGDPEAETLDIWYQPAKKFIPYYRP